MTALGFVTKTTAKAKTDSAETARLQPFAGIILQASLPILPKPKSLHPHSFVILRPDNPDYTARDVMAARVDATFGGPKDKCIQTH
jgi:hypothetical protein